MKSERRHELQHNALADWLFDTYETIRPYGSTIVGVIAVIVLVFAAWLWWTKQSALDRGASWNDLFMAQMSGNPAGLSDVADKYSGTPAGEWASVVAGDMYLSSGCEQLFTNKSAGSNDLNKAVDSYQKALKQSENSAVREQATYGLARAYEALSGARQSDLGKAVETYQKLIKDWPKGIYAKAAQQRLNDLNSPAIKQFYDKFAQYDPKPAFTDEAGKRLPFDPNSLPNPGSLTLPTASPKSEPAKSEPTKSLPVKSGSAPGAAEKPAEPKAPAAVPPAPPVTK